MYGLTCRLLILVSGSALATTLLSGAANENNPPIASFNGRTFFLRQFGVDRKAIGERLRDRLGRSPTDGEVEEAIKEYEAARLLDLVKWEIIESTAARNQIRISEEDQRKVLRKVYTDEQARKIDRIYKTLPTALRKALADPEHEKEIYERYMKDLMPYALWKLHLTAPDVRERIKSLERARPPTRDDLCTPGEPLRRMLLERAVRNFVVRSGNPTGGEPTSRQREEAWNKWLREKLAGASVEIYDPAIRRYFDEYRRHFRTVREAEPVPKR